ncbi:hypothetical protein RM96_09335 [Cupriavidus sp. IDO]|nr:hypothetical protein RM96_09335 [Cupriavidus sp. IDO]
MTESIIDEVTRSSRAMAATFGVFLLVISLLEWGARYEAQAEVLHRNAEGLTAFQWKVAQCLPQMDT